MKPVVLLSICLIGLATAQYTPQRRLRPNNGPRIAARRSGPYARKVARRVQPSYSQQGRNARQSQDPFSGFGSFESESTGFNFDGPRFNPTQQDGAQYGRDGNRQRLNKQQNRYNPRGTNNGEFQRRQDASEEQQYQEERRQQQQQQEQQQQQQQREEQREQQRERQREQQQQKEQQQRQREREEQEFNARPAYPYSPPANKRKDNDFKAVNEDVERAPLSEKVYKPASGPAYATATNIEDLQAAPRFDDIQVSDGPIPAEQRELELAVFAGANAYKPEAVYQTEDRLEFQINGHKGPHSYRYGYDTGHGYNRQFRYEERDGAGYVKGRYGFFDKYGKLQVVNYEAHPEKGFHAEGAHVPHYPH
ncbi:transcription factor SPT20 homolog [Tigriopus californicus]|uniref:transcription factor SPT20 homolog n=1 Tax=Tigriopus californicus TaxID=6832 RepID=UPI0027D9EC82|nr:transcription factor SPT20 homolog [Tigriopus californicus]